MPLAMGNKIQPAQLGASVAQLVVRACAVRGQRQMK